MLQEDEVPLLHEEKVGESGEKDGKIENGFVLKESATNHEEGLFLFKSLSRIYYKCRKSLKFSEELQEA